MVHGVGIMAAGADMPGANLGKAVIFPIGGDSGGQPAAFAPDEGYARERVKVVFFSPHFAEP